MDTNDAQKLEKIEFDNVVEEMKQKGYKRKDHIISAFNANMYGILTPLPFVVIIIAYFVLAFDKFTINYVFNLPNFLLILIISLIVHEFIHGLFWSFSCKDGFKDIKFGVNIKALMVYAHCKKPLTKNQYLLGAIMPFTILGIIPMILMFIFPNSLLYIVSLINVLVAGGDLLIILSLRKCNKTDKIFDHPTDAGYVAFEKE